MPGRDTPSQPTLTEIIVTAQKRQENIQDVPISVMALSGQELQDAGVKDIKNLQVLTPGVTVTSTTSENVTTARIRGIGTVGDNPGLESSVGVIIDGVYRARNGVGFGDLGEIERIEVLEGPQGELFGKNNDAGVINIVTKRPSNTFGVTAEVTGGNYNDREASASVTGPLGRHLRRRDSMRDTSGATGSSMSIPAPGPNTENNTDDRNVYTMRGQYLLTPSDNVSFLVIGDYSKRNESCCGAIQTADGPFSGIINALASVPALGGTPGATGIASPPLALADRQCLGQPADRAAHPGHGNFRSARLGSGLWKAHLDFRVARQHPHCRQRRRLHLHRYRSRARQRGQPGRLQAGQPRTALGRQERPARLVGGWILLERAAGLEYGHLRRQ